jgi:hypothetical protein
MPETMSKGEDVCVFVVLRTPWYRVSLTVSPSYSRDNTVMNTLNLAECCGYFHSFHVERN